MSRKRKASGQQKEAATAANQVASSIIEEEQIPVRERSRRRKVSEVRDGEIVNVRNKVNGAINKMAAVQAVKLVSKSEALYEILK